jgi:hypothetical protein
MNARTGRWSLLAGVAVTSLALGGCGGSSSPPRSKHAVFVPPGLVAGAGGSGGSRPPSSTSSAATTGTTTAAPTPTATATATPTATATATPTAAATPGAGAGAGTSSVPGTKVTFAAPGGQSPAAFVASADAICRSFRAQARAIGGTATTLAAQETELEHLVAATEQSVKQLTDLSPPIADAAGLRRFAGMTVASVIAFAEAQSRSRSTSEAVGVAVEARDLAASSRSSRDAAAAQAASRKLGLHVCGSPGSAWL